MIIASPSTSIPTRSGTCMRLNVACAATGSVGATTAPSTNAAGHERPSISSCAATATAAHRRQHQPRAPARSAAAARRAARAARSRSPPRPAAAAGRRGRRRRVDDHLGQARHGARGEPDEHERDRVRDVQPGGAPHERGGPEQEDEQELEVGHVSGRVYDRTVPASLAAAARPRRPRVRSRRRAVRARDVRRLRMPLLRGLAVDPRARAQAAGGRAALRLPPPAAGVRAPARPPRRRGGRGRGRPGRVLGDARRALRRARQARGRRPGRPRARTRPRRRARRSASWPPASTRAGSSATPRPREALGLSSTPAFFVNGVHYADAYDAGSLVAALRG